MASPVTSGHMPPNGLQQWQDKGEREKGGTQITTTKIVPAFSNLMSTVALNMGLVWPSKNKRGRRKEERRREVTN